MSIVDGVAPAVLPGQPSAGRRSGVSILSLEHLQQWHVLEPQSSVATLCKVLRFHSRFQFQSGHPILSITLIRNASSLFLISFTKIIESSDILERPQKFGLHLYNN